MYFVITEQIIDYTCFLNIYICRLLIVNSDRLKNTIL
jgi:hypothetical protein